MQISRSAIPAVAALALANASPTFADDAFRYGLQVGITAASSSRPDVSSRFSGPDLGLHAFVPLSRWWRLRLYGEYQRFGLSRPSVLFASATRNGSLDLLAQVAYQNYGTVLGHTYLGFGGGLGYEPGGGDALPWLAATWGTEFRRHFFVEARFQLPANGRITEQLYFVFLLGIHFNPREETWKESLIREKSGH